MKILFLAIGFLCLLAVEARAQTQSLTAQLTWTDQSNNEDGFIIERSVNKAAFVEVGRVATDMRIFNDTIAGDPGNTEYCYRVAAYNVVGKSPYAGPACKVSPLIVIIPAAPGGVTVILQVQVP